MKKMPCVFKRDYTVNGACDVCFEDVTPGCEWVLAGEGVAYRKYDGTACMISDADGSLWARYDCKRGKVAPEGAIPCQEPDAITGHWPHWVKAVRPEDVWIREAYMTAAHSRPGTYEACGPKIGANHEGLFEHMLLPHKGMPIELGIVTRASIFEYLSENEIEGLVFHHPDGRMAKIRRSDFGLQWPPERLP